MNITHQAGVRLFDLVVHAAWADHKIAVEELAAARAAARMLHPDGEVGARGKLALGPDRSLVSIAGELTFRERALGYAVAAWVVLSDGVEHPCESAMLDRWRLLAGLPRDITSALRRVVRRARATSLPPTWDSELLTLLRESDGALDDEEQPLAPRTPRLGARRWPSASIRGRASS